jgi:nitrogen fixation protein NifX
MGKVAVATTDGVQIDGEFNKIQQFYIYEVAETGEYRFFEQRNIKAYLTQFPTEDALNVIAQLPADLEAVLAEQIDPDAERELYDKGIIALIVNLPIDKAVTIYGKKSKFLKRNNKILRFGGACSGSGCSNCTSC